MFSPPAIGAHVSARGEITVRQVVIIRVAVVRKLMIDAIEPMLFAACDPCCEVFEFYFQFVLLCSIKLYDLGKLAIEKRHKFLIGRYRLIAVSSKPTKERAPLR